MKQCTVCKEFKELEDFYKSTRMKDGRMSACKVCHGRQNSDAMNKKPEKYSAIRRKSYEKAVKRYKDWKSQFKCSFCTENEPVCLQLHHKDPSKKDIQVSFLRTYSWDRFMSEAVKCIMVCGNCHDKIHAGIIDDSNAPTIGDLSAP